MNPNSWLFRVASDPKWGGGHVSRCRVLASEFARNGIGTGFWLDSNDGGWTKILHAAGFDTVPDTAAAGGTNWRGMLVDGYELMDAATLNDMRSVARPVVCIVDHIPPQIDVDLTINPGADPVESGAGHLSGFECALVDPAFADVLPSDGAEVARLLVALGRTDICGASPKVVRALTKATFPSSPPAVTVVLGSNSPLLDDVRGALADYPGSGALCVDEADMVTQFAEADAVVVAGGVSLLECLAAGRPNCVVQTADNQSGNVRQAVSQGGSIDGG